MTLNVEYLQDVDQLVVEGVRFSGDFFRDLAKSLPVGIMFFLEKREDGVIVIRRVAHETGLTDWIGEAN